MNRLSFALVAVLAVSAPLGAQEQDLPYGIIIAEQNRATFTLLGAGARAAGMGGAFTAVADDATAASFNPAGLAQLLVPEMSVVGSYAQLTDEYSDFVSFGANLPPLFLGDSTIEHDRSSLNFLSFTLPFRLAAHRWAVQVSHHRRVDFDYEGVLEFDAVTGGGQSVFSVFQGTKQSGDISTLSASIAVKLTRRTLIGISVNRWDGDWWFVSDNRSIPTEFPTVVQRFTYEQSNSFEGTNVDLGLLLRYPHFNIGVRYSTAFDADYSFRATVNEPEDLRGFSGLDTTLHWPDRLNLGLALKPVDRWIIALDWGRTDWSGFTFDLPTELGFSVPLNFFDLMPEEVTVADQADDWRAGTEVLFFAGRTIIPIRLGWFREPQPARDIYTGERLEWEGYTIGFGIKHGGFAFDVAAQYKTAEAVVSRFFLAEDLRTSDLSPNSVGTLKREDMTIVASLIFQFGDDAGLGKVFRSIFVGPDDTPPADAPPDE